MLKGDPLYYTAYFNGDTYSTGSYLGSDAKLKKNIREVNNAMDIINQLKPKIMNSVTTAAIPK